MCSPTAAVIGVGIGAQLLMGERSRREARRATRSQEAAAEAEKARIAENVEAVNEQFGSPVLQSRIEGLTEARREGLVDDVEAAFEQQANQLDLRLARSGIAGGVGRDQLSRQRLRRFLGRGRAGAAIDAAQVRQRLRNRLEEARQGILDRVRSGADAPGSETVLAGQTATLSEAAANIPAQTTASVINQATGALDIDTRARSQGYRGLPALDFMDRRGR